MWSNSPMRRWGRYSDMVFLFVLYFLLAFRGKQRATVTRLVRMVTKDSFAAILAVLYFASIGFHSLTIGLCLALHLCVSTACNYLCRSNTGTENIGIRKRLEGPRLQRQYQRLSPIGVVIHPHRRPICCASRIYGRL